MQQDTHSLSCKTFQGYYLQTLESLWVKPIFADVTLVSNEQTEIKAHKALLSTCSQFLKKLLLISQDSDPVVHIEGTNHQDLLSILQFMYTGKIIEQKDKIGNLKDIARNLEVEKLEQVCNEAEDKLKNETIIMENIELYNLKETSFDKDSKQEHTIEKNTVRSKDDSCISEIAKFVTSNQQYADYLCYQCDYKSRDKGNLKKHILSKHDGIRFCCSQCSYRAFYKGDLKKHKQSKHEGVRYACCQCDYLATDKGNLDKHKQSQHQCAKY